MIGRLFKNNTYIFPIAEERLLLFIPKWNYLSKFPVLDRTSVSASKRDLPYIYLEEMKRDIYTYLADVSSFGPKQLLPVKKRWLRLKNYHLERSDKREEQSKMSKQAFVFQTSSCYKSHS